MQLQSLAAGNWVTLLLANSLEWYCRFISLVRHTSWEINNGKRSFTIFHFTFLGDDKWPMCKLDSGWGSCGCYLYSLRRVVPAIPALIGHLRKSKKRYVFSDWKKNRVKGKIWRKERDRFKLTIIWLSRIASDWGCVLICGSYAPGLGQSGVGQPGSDMDYMEMIGNNELPSIDENLNLDHLNTFNFDFIQYNQSTKLQ